MKKLKKLLVIILSSLIITFPANAVSVGNCEKPSDAVRIWLRSFMTLYNIFPIRLGGFKLLSFGMEDYKSTNQIVCICMTPFPRIGITLSFWEPHALIEAVETPWCFPTLGIRLPVPIGSKLKGKNEGVNPTQEDRTYQVHYIRFFPFAILQLFTDFICLSWDNPLDILYVTEVDPIWQDDTLALLMFPESILLANPITLTACVADSIKATTGFPFDALFWCAGAWGYMTPVTKNMQTDKVQGSALAVARMLYKLHREMVLWGTSGNAALCGPYPMPIIKKKQYGIFPIWPLMSKKRFPIGRDELTGWGYGKDIPFKNKGNWVYPVYRKRDCCAF